MEHLSPQEGVWVSAVAVASWPVLGDLPVAKRLG